MARQYYSDKFIRRQQAAAREDECLSRGKAAQQQAKDEEREARRILARELNDQTQQTARVEPEQTADT